MQKQRIEYRLIYFILMLIELFLMNQAVYAQKYPVNYEFAPEQYYTLIGLPDDWQKTMATERGSLAYDFGPGPYARHLTDISFGLKGVDLRVESQSLPNGRTPIVHTTLAHETSKVHLTTFALVPDNYQSPSLPQQLTYRVSRVNGWNGTLGWARPDSTLDPSFANVAWGTNRAIRYRLSVDQYARYTIAMGFLEAWKSTARARFLDLRVEGAEPLVIDPLADGQRGKAYVHLFDAHDVNGDGSIFIEVHPSGLAPDPNTFLSTFWVFTENFEANPDDIAHGRHNSEALLHFDCGRDIELAAPNQRHDAIIATFDGATAQPVLTIRTQRSLQWTPDSTEVTSAGLPFLWVSPAPVSMIKTDTGWEFVLPEGTTEAYVVARHGLASSTNSYQDGTIDGIRQQVGVAAEFWANNTLVPKNPISVPDRDIQFLSDAALRNMYQVRERVNGLLQFQPGPSVYRGLWVADMILNGGAALAAGDTSGTREYLEASFPYQDENGHFKAMVPHISLYENPVLLTGAFLYGRATDNRKWLLENWDALSRGTNWIQHMRQYTLVDSAATNYGLMPAGFVDGGISDVGSDYGSSLWSLTALEYATRTAQMIGKQSDAEKWNHVYTDMLRHLERAVQRDLQTDEHSQTYLPAMVGQRQPPVPQLGQYGIIWPARYARFMDTTDGVMGSLRKTSLPFYESRSKQGLLAGAGWLQDGLWIWLSGIHGAVQLQEPTSTNAINTMYAIANHASPTGTWVEEQLPKALGNRTTGDVSNSESSAAFYMLVRDMILHDRRNELHILKGVIKDWLIPGEKTALMNSYTEFGKVDLLLEVNPNGNTITLDFSLLITSHTDKVPVLVYVNHIVEAGFTIMNGNPIDSAGKPVLLSVTQSNQQHRLVFTK